MASFVIPFTCKVCQTGRAWTITEGVIPEPITCGCGQRYGLKVSGGHAEIEVLDPVEEEAAVVREVKPAVRETKPAKRVAKKVTK